MAAAKSLFDLPPGAKDVDPPEPQTAPEGSVTVNLEDDDEGEDEPPPAAADPTRRERRRNRVSEFRERTEKAERDAEEARIRAEQSERRVAAFEAEMARMRAETQRPADDPNKAFKEKRRAIREQQNRVRRDFESLPEEEQRARFQQYQEELDDLDDQIHAARAPAPQLDQRAIAQQAQIAAIQAQNNDVFGNPRVRSLMESIWKEKVGFHGKTPSYELMMETIQETRERAGLVRPKPTEADKRRFTGYGNGNGGGRSPAPKEVHLSPMERKMADEAFRHLDKQEDRYKAYARLQARKD